MKAVWQDEKRRFCEGGLKWFGSLRQIFGSAWCVKCSALKNPSLHCTCRTFATGYSKITLIEFMMDSQASLVKLNAWTRGLYLGGLAGAHDAAAGLY